MSNDTDRALDALMAIPPDLPRDDWHKVGRAAIAAGLSVDDIDRWSAGAKNYKSTQDVRAAFRNITPDGGTQAGTLFKIAAENGWRIGNTSQRPAPAKAPRPTVETRKQPAKGNSASDVWSRCIPATNRHGYLVAKQADGVPLDCLRVVPMDSPMRIAGESVAGYLAVPAFAHDGSMQSIQFIPPNGGKKLNLPGASMSGACFTIGTEGTTYLCEGAASAWSAWKATGHRAVCCFGWGNIRRIVESMRQHEPDAKLIVCPDRGKENDAKKIADEFHCSVACLPECELNNFDLNDLFCRDGFDVVQALLESATTETPKPETKLHPLARFIDLNSTPKPPRWVIPGFIGHGVTVIAGAHGVGKTTALLPLAMSAAGLYGDELLPRQWRHVIYVSEDVEQALRLLTGIVNHGNLNLSMETVRERIHIVEAVRLDPVFVAAVGSTYREQFTRTVEDVEVLPLVVLDTKSAVLALDNENDNAEASRMMAALKQGFYGLPVWLIGHVAKANLGRSDVAALTSRGASAIEGDANQTMFLVREGECRYLVLGKVRFEPMWQELEITSYTAQEPAHDEFGNVETIVMRWGIAAPALQSRKEAAEQAAEQQRKEDDATLREDIREAVDVAWLTGNPLSREGVKAKAKRKHCEVLACLESMLNERWIHEVFVPAKERLHPRKSSFFISLTTQEHEAVLAGGGLPDAKLVIPASWKKEPVSIMPDIGHGCTRSEEVDHA